MNTIRKIPVTAGLIIINIVLFLIVDFTGGTENTRHMISWGAAVTPAILENHEWYRLVTAMFLHFGIEHLLNNMLVLFVLGERLELLMGHFAFLILYFLGGIGGNLLSMYYETRTGDYAVSAGASGAVFALMGGLIYVLIRNRGRAADLTLRRILIMAAFSLYLGFTSQGVNNMAHLGGMLCGFAGALLLYRGKGSRLCRR